MHYEYITKIEIKFDKKRLSNESLSNIYKILFFKKVSNYRVKDRIDLAKKIKQDYNASNRQIKSILKLDPGVVDELFPNV